MSANVRRASSRSSSMISRSVASRSAGAEVTQESYSKSPIRGVIMRNFVLRHSHSCVRWPHRLPYVAMATEITELAQEPDAGDRLGIGELEVLEAVQRRVLWLAMSMVHHAN